MTTALFVCAATRLSYVLRSAPRQYVRPHRSVQIISFRRCASPVSHSSDSSHSPSFSLIRNNHSPLCYRWFWKVRAAYREKSSLLRKLESARRSVRIMPADAELSSLLSRRQRINDELEEGKEVKKQYKFVNVYTEFHELSRREIKQYEQTFNRWVFRHILFARDRKTLTIHEQLD